METIELDFSISYFPQLKIIFIVLKLYRTNLICNKTIYHNKNNKFMSQNKLVKETLTLPSEVPFFNYNINFDGLRKVVQDIGIQANENSNRIARLEQSLPKKLQAIDFTKLQKTLDQSFSLGTNCQKYLEEHQSLAVKVTSKDPKQMEFIERYCKKIQKLSQIVQVLMVQSKDHGEKLQSDDKKHEKMISESFRRLQDKIDISLDSFNKTINDFFSQSNRSVTDLQSSLNTFKLTQQFKLAEITNDLSGKISQYGAKNMIEASQSKVKKEISAILDSDQMKRLSALNQYSAKLKQQQKDLQLQQKVARQKLEDMSLKVAKCITNASFQAEKHKIYQKLAQYRGRIDELNKKNHQFVDFRKQTLSNNQKVKQHFVQLEEQIKKLNSKQSSFKKMENVSDMLSALDPHLVCEIANQVKLHDKQIGKLQKQLMLQQYELKNIRINNTPTPEVNSGQNADFLAKMIKQYMSNLDFDGRVKKMQRDVHELSKKSDGVHDLQKKIYLLTKEMDVSVIMKEIKRKADQDATNKDIRIIDGKVEKLFDFYKSIRKQLEQYARRASKNIKQPFQNASMTTKKLYPANCLSCTPQQGPRRRHFSAKNKVDITSFDQGISIEVGKNSSYLKPKIRS